MAQEVRSVESSRPSRRAEGLRRPLCPGSEEHRAKCHRTYLVPSSWFVVKPTAAPAAGTSRMTTSSQASRWDRANLAAHAAGLPARFESVVRDRSVPERETKTPGGQSGGSGLPSGSNQRLTRTSWSKGGPQGSLCVHPQPLAGDRRALSGYAPRRARAPTTQERLYALGPAPRAEPLTS